MNNVNKRSTRDKKVQKGPAAHQEGTIFPPCSFVSPQRENRAQNRALYRALYTAQKTVICFNDFYKSVTKMGREYFHWVDLRLIKPMEVVI